MVARGLGGGAELILGDGGVKVEADAEAEGVEAVLELGG